MNNFSLVNDIIDASKSYIFEEYADGRFTEWTISPYFEDAYDLLDGILENTDEECLKPYLVDGEISDSKIFNLLDSLYDSNELEKILPGATTYRHTGSCMGCGINAFNRYRIIESNPNNSIESLGLYESVEDCRSFLAHRES